MSQTNDVDSNVWKIRRLTDLGIIFISGVCLVLFLFVLPSPPGALCAVALLVAGFVFGGLDITKKWPASWKERFKYQKSYRYWWLWVAFSSVWFVIFGLQVTNPRTSDLSGLMFMTGVFYIFKGVNEKIITRILATVSKKEGAAPQGI